MLEQYNPLTTVKEASIQSGLTIKELKKLIDNKVIMATKIGGNTLYVDNLSLEDYLAKVRKEAFQNQETTIRSYKSALQEGIHKAKVEAVKLNLKTYQKSQKLAKKLQNEFYFTEALIEKYSEEGTDFTKIVNRYNKVYDITLKGNEGVLEFFTTYKSIKEDYETKIDYPLEDSVVADIEEELRKKFHIDLPDKGGK